MPLMVQMLVRPASLDLVEVALDTVSKNSSPGSDGIHACIYSALCEFFVPLMHKLYHQVLQTGKLNPDWVEALFNLIPKALGQVGVEDLKPLVLRNCYHKWTAAIVLLQLHALISAIMPSY